MDSLPGLRSPSETDGQEYEKQIKVSFLNDAMNLCRITNCAIFVFSIILFSSVIFAFIFIPVMCLIFPFVAKYLLSHKVNNFLTLLDIFSVFGVLVTVTSNVAISKYLEYRYNKLLGDITINELFAVEKLIPMEDKFTIPPEPDTISYL